jgi:pyrroloquinoline-quinone synthase
MEMTRSKTSCSDATRGPDTALVLTETRRLLARQPIIAQRYFARLRDGTMDRAAFLRSQRQFFFAVRFFSRPIAALISRLPDSARRIDLVHNLAEEQGDFLPEQAHDRTFAAFLQSLGTWPAEMEREEEGAAVQAFNHALLGVCLGGEVVTAFGCLGVIEYAFAEISALIGRAVVDCGWVADDDLVHYKLHAEIDQRHAAEFFAIIEPDFADPAKRRLITQGLALGHYLFARLYEDLDTLAAAP